MTRSRECRTDAGCENCKVSGHFQIDSQDEGEWSMIQHATLVPFASHDGQELRDGLALRQKFLDFPLD